MQHALSRALYRTLRGIPRCFPRRLRTAARLALARRWYDFVNRLDPEGEARFFNYGWIPPDEESDPPWTLERCQAALYSRVVAASLRGKDVLEVGCGRGGGAWWVWRRCAPRFLIGLDLSTGALHFCARNYRSRGLHFVQAAAGSLPFAAASFDAVVNVESSHAYPSLQDFAFEVARVLRPHGVLLFADFRKSSELDLLRRQLASPGLRLEQQEDLTEGVLRSLLVTDACKRALIARKAPWYARAVLEDFAGVSGTPVYTGLRSGTLVYVRLLLRKERT
ncbi:MAG TPA: class I SAM-dependent methyltransferase [Bryobacteraceae bacterium]|nr:class I SAM-dependent methyltransferase [Bryobacteraceae bacterium]